MEVLIVEPRFFPTEIKWLLVHSKVFILGVAVFDDLVSLYKDETTAELKTIDLSVLASDLPTNDHSRPGMAGLIKDVLEVDVSHLKKAKEGRFKGLRTSGWNRENISEEKILYAALDAVVVFPIFFKVLKHWIGRYEKGDVLNGVEISWDTVLEKILGPLVNRIRKGGSERMECLERDPPFQTAGLTKSIHAADL